MEGPRPADFRSDTVTRPTAAMRRAMAEAEVGDDVFGEDPTVLDLEAHVAALFGREAALFVPSGCQGNQIAVRLQTEPAEEVALGADSHTLDWELAGLAALSGVQARVVPTVRGRMDADAVASTLRAEAGGFRPACRLLLLENTHNFHGGAVVDVAHLEALAGIARERGARVHLDGARLWNAAVASDTPLERYGRVADTIMVCLSKGLGAPVGSMLVGDRTLIGRAREVRKLLGGGMRQVGVLAAPARVAVDTMRERLAEDHALARRIADALVEDAGAELPHGPPDTNIVIARLPGVDAAALQTSLAAAGVLLIATGAETVRIVTHHDVGDADADRLLEAVASARVRS